jgi:hypothetical protein
LENNWCQQRLRILRQSRERHRWRTQRCSMLEDMRSFRNY